MRTLNKKWVLLYVLGCLVTAGICVGSSIAWLFEGNFHECSAIRGIGIAVFLQATTLMITSKSIFHDYKGISIGEFHGSLFQLLGSKVLMGASTFLVGVSLLVSAMMIWKTYSLFF